MSIKNARTLGLRLDSTDAERVAKFEKETAIEGVSLARAALKAALDHYEANGEIALPLRLTVLKKGEEPAQPVRKIISLNAHIDRSQIDRAAEDETGYKA